MANFDIKNPPEFVQDLRKLMTTDRGHADVYNALFSVLINNDAYLKAFADELRLTQEAHTADDGIHVTPEDKKAWYAEATQTTAGRMKAADKKKLDNIADGAEVNQNAYGKVVAGKVTIVANGKTSTLNLVAGSNVTITGDNANKKITIGVDLPSTMPPSAHKQSASTITDGTFDGTNVKAKTGTDYTTARVRNVMLSSTVPTSLANGDICLVHS